MRGSQCLYNPQRALLRAFVSPARRSPAATVFASRPPFSAARDAASAGVVAPGNGSHQLRFAGGAAGRRMPPRPPARRQPAARDDDDVSEHELDSGTPKERAEREAVRRGFTTQAQIDASGRRPPQDLEITDPRIMVIDEGAPEGPLSTSYVRTKLSPDEALRMIRPYIPANPDTGVAAEYAVCKIVNKVEEYQRQRERKRASKEARGGAGGPTSTRVKTKEVEVNWVISEHDLATKKRQMAGFLEKGMKVEVVLAWKRKKGSRGPMQRMEQDQAKAMVEKLRADVLEKGGRETKHPDGRLAATMRLFFEGRRVAS